MMSITDQTLNDVCALVQHFFVTVWKKLFSVKSFSFWSRERLTLYPLASIFVFTKQIRFFSLCLQKVKKHFMNHTIDIVKRYNNIK